MSLNGKDDLDIQKAIGDAGRILGIAMSKFANDLSQIADALAREMKALDLDKLMSKASGKGSGVSSRDEARKRSRDDVRSKRRDMRRGKNRHKLPQR